MNRKFSFIAMTLWSLLFCSVSFGFVKGIYITQPTLENSGKIRHLIDEARSVGINTFVVDVSRRSRAFDQNIKLVTGSGLRFVARVVVFPQGGSVAQINDDNAWQGRMGLINYAIDHGAKVVQLDYIRFNTGVAPSPRNADKINHIIAWFKNQVHQRGAKLQIDVFGETSYKPSLSIGQNVKEFAPSVDSISPMLYPSHWDPYVWHSQHPYDTVYNSLKALQKQFANRVPVSVVAFIETSNYRYHIDGQERLDYIHAQLRAVEDAGIDGWYAWSANNYYNGLFRVLHHTVD